MGVRSLDFFNLFEKNLLSFQFSKCPRLDLAVLATDQTENYSLNLSKLNCRDSGKKFLSLQ